MHRFWEYTIFLVSLLLLQALLFDNLNLTIYVMPLVYVSFLVMLPLNTPRPLLLGLGLLTGVIADFFMGTSGINTIASLATAYMRPAVALLLGKDANRESETPSPRLHGTGKWLNYTSVLVAAHCLIFFLFEAMSFQHIWFTLLRALCSGTVTFLLVWFIGAIYPVNRSKKGS